MPFLQMFGTQFKISGSVTEFPNLPHVTGTWNGTLANQGTLLTLDAKLTIGNTNVFDIAATIALQADANGNLSPRDGNNPQSDLKHLFLYDMASPPPPGVPLWLAIGPIQQESSSFPPQVLTGAHGEIVLTFPVMDVISGADLPIGINLERGFLLNLSKPALQFLDDWASLFHNATLRVVGPPMAALQRRLRSNRFDLSLLSSVQTLPLTFASRTGQTLPLYVDYFDPPETPQLPTPENPLVAALSVHDYLLRVTIGMAGALPTVRALSVQGENLQLRASAYSTADNSPALFSTPTEIGLHVRPGVFHRPSTLLIANNFPGASSAPVSAPTGKFHGPAAHVQFECTGSAVMICADREPYAGSMPSGIDPSLVSEMTYPKVKFAGTGNSTFIAKPGDAYLAGGTAEVQTYAEQGAPVVIPFISPTVFRNSGTARGRQFVADIDHELSDLIHVIGQSQHETLVAEDKFSVAESTVHIDKLYSALADRQNVQLKTHKLKLTYGPIVVTVEVPSGYEPAYYVVNNNSMLTVRSGDEAFSFDPAHPSFNFKGLPFGRSGVAAIVKLSHTMTLLDIFKELNQKQGFDYTTVDDYPELKFADDVIDPSLMTPEWTGLIMFSLPIDVAANQPVLHTLLDPLLNPEPSPPIRLAYLSISPERTDTSQTPPRTDFSVAGRLLWRPAKPPQPPVGTNEFETRFHITQLDVAWADRTLQKFYLDSTLVFDRFFGMTDSTKTLSLEIIGSYDRKRGELRFLGQFSQPLALLPSNNKFGPFKQVFLKSAEVRTVNGKTVADLSGSIDLADLPFGALDGLKMSKPALNIDFQDLHIGLDGWKTLALEISYPSLRFNFDAPPFNFGFIGVQLRSIFADWHNSFDWGSLVPISGFGSLPTGLRIAIEFKLELMKMPELSLPGIDRLVLDLFALFGQGSDGRWSPDFFSLGLRALSFDHLNIDLMRFLEISADHVALEPGQETIGGAITRITWLQFQQVKVKIVGRTIIDDMSFLLFSSSKGQGFVAVFTPQSPVGVGLLQIRWALIAHNVALPDKLPEQLITVSPAGGGDDTAISKSLKDAIAKLQFLAGTKVNAGGWIFAAGFSLVGLFDAKFLFQDHAYYGISVGGGVFKDWFGYDFGISVLYVKASKPDQDAFIVSVRVPYVVMGPVAFTGGVISLEVVMNGGFTLNIGFPTLQSDGGRNWSASLGAIITPFQGSGGFYFRRHTLSTAGQDVLQLSGGYAVQCGLGASAGGGIFQVWARIGLFFILEGDVYLNTRDRSLRALRVTGAVGVLVQVAGELNWWVISIRIEVTLSAEARATLSFGDLMEFTSLPTPKAMLHAAKQSGAEQPERALLADAILPPPHKDPGFDKLAAARPGAATRGSQTTLTVDLTVYASAHAEACIGGGWFRICAGIDVTVPIHCGFTINLGS